MRREYLKSIFVIATILGTVSISNSAFAADINNLGDLTDSGSYTSNSTTNINSNINLGSSASNGAELPTIQNVTNLVVNGNYKTLSGNIRAQESWGNYTPDHYVVENSTVSFSNIIYDSVITNCLSSGGTDTRVYTLDGGLFKNNSSTLSLENVTFSNNTHDVDNTRSSRAEIGAYVYGGIINTNDGTTNLTNVSFDNNTVYTRGNKERSLLGNSQPLNSHVIGGLIYNSSSENTTSKLGITGGSFSNNAIRAELSEVYEDDTDKATSITGGLIYNNGEATITGTTFNNNTAYTTANRGTVSNLGGVIYNDTNSTLTIDGSVFTNNTTASNTGTVLGGAIYNKGTINISDTIFDNNRAGIANDIDSAKTSAALNDIYFDSNSSMNVVAGGMVQIGSGLASKDDSAQITIKDGANLVVSGGNDSSAYTGSVEVQSNGLLSFFGSPDVVNTFDNAKEVLFSGDLSGLEYSLDDDYTLTSDDFSNFTIGDNVNQLMFLKS